MSTVQTLRPVTLLTGFLGAGKTTLLNHLLGASNHRFVVIENEFGDLSIDGALVSSPEGSLFELTEGCVCCTVREDLIAVFAELASSKDVDHVIIEASGLADPVPVLRIFDTPVVRQSFRLNGVVTVVDAGHIEASLGESETCADQITAADLILLNKVGSLSETVLEPIEARLRGLNPLARVVRADYAKVGPSEVLELGQRRLEPGLAPQRHGHSHHHHDDGITSVSIEVEGDVDVRALDRWLGGLARRGGLLRGKGIFAIAGHPQRFVFHSVRSTVEVRPDRPWGDAPRLNQLVFIGRGLDQNVLRQGLQGCLRTEA